MKKTSSTQKNKLLDAVALVVHAQWMDWSQSIAEEEKISDKRLLRWHALWIPYDELPEKEKRKDREWAKHYIKLIEGDLKRK